MHLSGRSMAQNNIAFLFLIFGLAAVGGSVVGVGLVISAIWALIYLALGRLPLRYDTPILIFSSVLLFYVGINALFFLLHFGESFNSRLAEYSKFTPLLLFLAPLFLIQRFAIARCGDLLVALQRASAVGALLALPLALVQSFVFLERAEGGSGNAIPFALTCALLSMLSLPGLLERRLLWRMIGLFGFVAGYLCVFLSQTKGLMPVPLVAALLFGLFFLRKHVNGATCIGAVVIVLVVAVIGFYASGSAQRFNELSNLFAGDANIAWGQSYTERLGLWSKALDLVQSGFLDGHGVQNRRALIKAAGYSYSHFHNGFITATVDNGILGLVALLALLISPLAIALRAPRDTAYGPRLFMAFCLVSTYVVGGMTNFIFGHDIYDAMFLWISTVLIASSISDTTVTAPVNVQVPSGVGLLD